MLTHILPYLGRIEGRTYLEMFSNHWGMVTYTFFWNNFFGSLIRARTGSFANVSGGTSPLYIKVGQISGLSKNGSWALVDGCNFFFLIY